MSSTTFTPSAQKSAYQRPYKSRSQRREIDRRKQDEANDYKFLIRVGVAIGLIAVIALGFAIKGLAEG